MFNKIFSLNLKRQEYRRFVQLGNLETLDYPVETQLEFIPGIDYHTYNDDTWMEAAADDGFPQFRALAAIGPPRSEYEGCITWGQMRIMRRIVEEQVTALVLEDDMLLQLRYPYLCEKLTRLYENAPVAPEIIMLHYAHWEAPTRREVVPGTDGFWVQGSRNSGNHANIYTPVGAQRVLDHCESHPDETLEWVLKSAFGDAEWLYSTRVSYAKESSCRGTPVGALVNRGDEPVRDIIARGEAEVDKWR